MVVKEPFLKVVSFLTEQTLSKNCPTILVFLKWNLCIQALKIFDKCFQKKREIRKPNFLSELAHYDLTSFDCGIQ